MIGTDSSMGCWLKWMVVPMTVGLLRTAAAGVAGAVVIVVVVAADVVTLALFSFGLESGTFN